MNILICPDSFKDSLKSREICEVLFNEMGHLNPKLNIRIIPMADGGEGTIDVLHDVEGFERMNIDSEDSKGRSIQSCFLWNGKKKSVIMELAQTSGIERLRQAERNCMYTSSYGTGLQMVNIIQKYKPKKIYLTVGSSATNDAGLGMLAALGYKILDSQARPIKKPLGLDLIEVTEIVSTQMTKSLIDGVEFVIINDVDNPFSGKRGAAYTYATQKGANPEEVLVLDKGLKRIRDIVLDKFDINLDDCIGSGAAGGIAGLASVYLNAKLLPGTKFISDILNLEEAIKVSDWVITGEGKLDSQTLQGKLISYIANICIGIEKKVIIVCGVNSMTKDEVAKLGYPKIFALNEYNLEDFTQDTTIRDLKKIAQDILKICK